MELMNLLVIIVVFTILLLWPLLADFIHQLLGVKEKKISETPAKNIDRWRKGIVFVTVFITFPVAIDVIDFKWYMIFILILSMGSESIVEWKYLKPSKQYITTLIFMVIGILLIYSVDYVFNA